MPSDLKKSEETTGQPTVLLVEEYEPLGIAVRSALKKFAPQHVTRHVRSLEEAEKSTKKFDPDLFVIDFDPAYPGLTEFLQKMRAGHPNARVLVIAPNVSPELAAERRLFGALQFVEKPFEVANFGAAVQALLGPWKESESSHSRGTLSSLSVADIVMLQCAGGRDVVIEVKASNDQSGHIRVRNGQLFDAETGDLTGPEALEEMFAWSGAKMRETEKPSARRRSIKGPWPSVFLKACREIESRQPPRVIPTKETTVPKHAPKTGKKIVVIDDTEMLLIFVEDVLATADPQLQITTALNGTSGLKAIERMAPDLVLLDYSLPDLNGDEVCRRLLQNEQTARVPVLMMSGHIAEMSQVAAVLPNVVATIEKPFLSEALTALVQKTLSTPPAPKVVRMVEQPPPPPPRITAPKPSPEAPKVAKRERAGLKPPSVEVPQVPVQPPKVTPPLIPEPVPTLAPPLTQAFAPEVRLPRAAPISVPVMSTEPYEVVLGLFLEVVSMQLTDSLRMGAIRAKPSSSTVSLHVASAALRAALPPNGFQLGPVELDRHGRIATLRLIPTQQPFTPLETRNSFQIGGVAVVPANAHEQVQLISTVNAPMRMQLLANLELAGVELSTNFQVSQLVLKSRGNNVRVTLSSQSVGQEQTGTTCETADVRLDSSARIAELLLNPIR